MISWTFLYRFAKIIVMRRVKKLVKKGITSLRDEGVVEFIRKTRNYIVFHAKNGKKKSKIVKDILFINGCTLPHPERYRIDHQIEQLEMKSIWKYLEGRDACNV